MWTRHASVCRQTVGTVGACALLPTGFALRRARCRRRWRRCQPRAFGARGIHGQVVAIFAARFPRAGLLHSAPHRTDRRPSVVRCPHRRCSSFAPAPPQGAPSGSWQLIATRPCRWAPRHRFGCSSKPPSRLPIPPAFAAQAFPPWSCPTPWWCTSPSPSRQSK